MIATLLSFAVLFTVMTPSAALLPFAPMVTRAAAAAANDFNVAVALYEQAEYAAAAESFAQLAIVEPDSVRRAQLHANAGTAAARSENFGVALWHLESARVGTPRDASVARNLGMVRAWLGEGDISPDRLPVAWSEGALLLNADERQLTAAALFAFALLLLVLRRTGRMGRGLVVFAGSCALLGALLLAAAAHASELRATRAILLADASVRGEPDATADSLFRLAEGSEVRLLEVRGDFHLIATADDNKGWVLSDHARGLDVGAH